MSEQLSLLDAELAPSLTPCDCERHATCPRCDPGYLEQDGDRAAGIVPFGNQSMWNSRSWSTLRTSAIVETRISAPL